MKIDLGKSTNEEIEPCRSSTAVPFEDIGVDLREIWVLVSGLPMGPGGPSTTRNSCVARFDYEKYLADQQI